MKLFTATLCLFFLASGVFAADGDELTINVSVDTSSLRSLFMPSLYISGDLQVTAGDIGFSLPLTFIADGTGGDEKLFDLGLHLEIFPFSKGLFYSISLIETVIFLGPYMPESRVHTMNEMSLGYVLPLMKGLSLVPRLRVRNLSGTFTEELEYIQGFVPGYTMVDAAVSIRCTAALFNTDF